MKINFNASQNGCYFLFTLLYGSVKGQSVLTSSTFFA